MSKNEKKRSATTEEEIFEKVKNFPADLEKRKIELKTLKEKKEHAQWLKALCAMQTAMFQSIEYGLDHFSFIVDDLTEEQRDALEKKIGEFPNMKASWDKKSLRDSHEYFVMDVKVSNQ